MRIIFKTEGKLTSESDAGEETPELLSIISDARKEYAEKRKALQEEILAKYRPLLAQAKEGK